MPSLPSRPCRKAGCPALVKGGGYCPAHEHVERDRVWGEGKGGDATPYQDARWRGLRAAFLKQHPSCAMCGGKAVHVDHIVAVYLRPDLRLEWANLRSLCVSCHSTRTRRQYAVR